MPEEREARESHGRELLRRQNDIVVECRFDQAHMGRLLKGQIGLTPGEVRAAAIP